MPHIKFNSPYRTSDGVTHRQGTTAYVSSHDANGILADKRGEVVTPSPAEVVELATGEKPKPAAKTEAPAEAKPAARKPAPAEAKKPEDG